MERIDVDSGKYTVVIDGGSLTALRHGEPWRDLTGDKLIYWLAVELRDARAALSSAAAPTGGARSAGEVGAPPRAAEPRDTPAPTVADLQRELLSLCPSSRYARMTQPQADRLTNGQRQDRIALLRHQISRLDPNAALYYGWAGPDDEAPHRRSSDQ